MVFLLLLLLLAHALAAPPTGNCEAHPSAVSTFAIHRSHPSDARIRRQACILAHRSSPKPLRPIRFPHHAPRARATGRQSGIKLERSSRVAQLARAALGLTN